MYLVYISIKELFKQKNLWPISQEVQKDGFMSLERNQAIRKITSTLEGWVVHKGVSRRVASRKLVHMKYLNLKASSA